MQVADRTDLGEFTVQVATEASKPSEQELLRRSFRDPHGTARNGSLFCKIGLPTET